MNLIFVEQSPGLFATADWQLILQQVDGHWELSTPEQTLKNFPSFHEAKHWAHQWLESQTGPGHTQ